MLRIKLAQIAYNCVITRSPHNNGFGIPVIAARAALVEESRLLYCRLNTDNILSSSAKDGCLTGRSAHANEDAKQLALS